MHLRRLACEFGGFIVHESQWSRTAKGNVSDNDLMDTCLPSHTKSSSSENSSPKTLNQF